MARVCQRTPRPRRLVVVGPRGPVARGTGVRRAEFCFHPDHRPAPPSAHVDEKPELLPKRGIQTAVDERVVAGGAHSQPVEAEVKGVG